ncbi:hypothetical protein Scep_019544 [Stephania cephalantha]|uniref:Uncharacterized protein n=1 Tax=Stephania cephalantha TaxID=152367 RepID=A0AAP0IB37_9MAGN
MTFNGGLNSKNLRLSSSSRAIHRVVELRRRHNPTSTVVVSRRGSIGLATRHRTVAAESSFLLAGVLRAAARRLPPSRATS